MLRFTLATLPGLVWVVFALGIHAFTHRTTAPSALLPREAAQRLVSNLARATPQAWNVWRDLAPLNGDGTVNAYVEISRGDMQKWEFDVGRNTRVVDRIIPADVGGYPVNYGFVPQTVSYDGDPFDALVIGPPILGGAVVRGRIIGIFHMDDEGGPDSKVVVAPARVDGAATPSLSAAERTQIADYFRRYKRHEAGKFSVVRGWGEPGIGLAFVQMTHAFFRNCRTALTDCTVAF